MDVRRCIVAGQFYPAHPAQLRDAVKRYVTDSRVEAAPDRVTVIVVPHAGYVYSGPAAGYAYARVRGKKPKRIVLTGCSHRYPIATASVFTRGAFESPLGNFPVDEALAAELAQALRSQSPEPHLLEHSLEVQLPFIFETVGIVPIVPILFGGPASFTHAEYGRKIAALTDEDDLLIASTDLSHYLNEEEARKTDRHTLDTLLEKRIEDLIEGIGEERFSMCGASAVVAAAAYANARGATEWSLLDYRTSGAVSGDYDRVVGYAAVSMERLV
ncbi:MAG: hypothetical protein QG656_2369 [Candidatus Hydrogenedentes bacterium]|nr:hypothetical protein [Candidatus Hydrogenedentota bacterium]